MHAMSWQCAPNDLVQTVMLVFVGQPLLHVTKAVHLPCKQMRSWPPNRQIHCLARTSCSSSCDRAGLARLSLVHQLLSYQQLAPDRRQSMAAISTAGAYGQEYEDRAQEAPYELFLS
eukprot:1158436-Pelagomonas_calceolata.AAC.3